MINQSTRTRLVITKSGKPTAVLVSISDFDDMLEQLGPKFRKSLTAAAREHRSCKAVTLKDYLKQRLAGRRAG